jgi:hypothetical protein
LNRSKQGKQTARQDFRFLSEFGTKEGQPRMARITRIQRVFIRGDSWHSWFSFVCLASFVVESRFIFLSLIFLSSGFEVLDTIETLQGLLPRLADYKERPRSLRTPTRSASEGVRCLTLASASGWCFGAVR